MSIQSDVQVEFIADENAADPDRLVTAARPDTSATMANTTFLGGGARNVTVTSLVLQTQSGTTAPASVQYTDTERTIFCNITNTVDATTAGSFTFIIEYTQIA